MHTIMVRNCRIGRRCIVRPLNVECRIDRFTTPTAFVLRFEYAGSPLSNVLAQQCNLTTVINFDETYFTLFYSTLSRH